VLHSDKAREWELNCLMAQKTQRMCVRVFAAFKYRADFEKYSYSSLMLHIAISPLEMSQKRTNLG